MKTYLTILHCAEKFALVLALQFYLISSSISLPSLFVLEEAVNNQSLFTVCFLLTILKTSLDSAFSCLFFKQKNINLLSFSFYKSYSTHFIIPIAFPCTFSISTVCFFERKQTPIYAVA